MQTMQTNARRCLCIIIILSILVILTTLIGYYYSFVAYDMSLRHTCSNGLNCLNECGCAYVHNLNKCIDATTDEYYSNNNITYSKPCAGNIIGYIVVSCIVATETLTLVTFTIIYIMFRCFMRRANMVDIIGDTDM